MMQSYFILKWHQIHVPHSVVCAGLCIKLVVYLLVFLLLYWVYILMILVEDSLPQATILY
jgi:hypothetical protein